MHVADALQRAFDAALSHERTLMLVLDTAPAENSHAELDRMGVSYLSLFDGTPEESLLEIAPLLIPLATLDADLRRRVFTWVEKLAYAAACLTWLETDASPQDLARHLRQFHTVGLSDNQSMLMRWYDTRILPVWFACLSSDQAAAFMAHVAHCAYVDRFGEVSTLPLDAAPVDFPPAPACGEPLVTLTDAQYGMLVDATELDVLIKHLRQVIPDELKRVPARTLTEFVARHQQAALAAGFDDIDRQAQVVLLALYTGGLGTASPEFQALLKKPTLSLEALAQGIQALPDAVTEAGAPLWDTVPAHEHQKASNA